MASSRAIRPLAAALAALTMVLALAGCQESGGPASSGSPGETPSADRSGDPLAQDPALVRAARTVVRDRLAAVRSGDKEAFLATLDPGQQKFLVTQERWFDNVQDLPLARYDLDVVPGELPVTVQRRGDVQLVVRVSMQLEAYDARPVVQEGLFTFVRGPGDRVLLSDDRDLKYDASQGWLPAPWDQTRIVVRERGPVLGIFDQATVDQADRALTELVSAVEAVDAVVPAWHGHVVAYDITDTSSIDKMSAMEVSRTAGVAFPVFGGRDGDTVVGRRFAVNPETLSGNSAWIFRHELTHVALLGVDDGATTWLTEGAADYVAASALDPAARDATLRAMADQVAGVRDLAEGRDFYQVHPDRNYRTAFVACSWIAAQHGTDALWDLMDAMRRAEPVTDGDIDRVVRREIGVDTRQLTAAAIAWAGA